jgi:hypothetical protein
MRNSHLLDRGTEKIIVYPEVRDTDRRGNSYVTYSNTPIVRKIHVATDRQSDAELIGQVAVKILRFTTRTIPGLSSQSLVWFRGEYWDLAKPETMSRQTRALSHGEYVIRSRNQVGPDPVLAGTGPLVRPLAPDHPANVVPNG